MLAFLRQLGTDVKAKMEAGCDLALFGSLHHCRRWTFFH